MIPVPSLQPSRALVTFTLTALAAGLEIVCLVDEISGGGRNLREVFYNDLRLGIWLQVWKGELWRPVTTTLLHGNVLHMAFNVYAMTSIGAAVEARLGPLRMAGLTVLLAYASTMVEYAIGNYFTPVIDQHAMVGLSGIVFGLFGFTLIGRRSVPEFARICSLDTIVMFGGWFLLCLLLTATRLLAVANLAHASGCAFGAVYALASYGPNRTRWTIAAVISTLAIAAVLIACPGHPAYELLRENSAR
jgi:membrane associated rhomboid family serine protease